ncbi:hypothetical protein Trydic_g14892 [Trypoxylus dichotomus]
MLFPFSARNSCFLNENHPSFFTYYGPSGLTNAFNSFGECNFLRCGIGWLFRSAGAGIDSQNRLEIVCVSDAGSIRTSCRLRFTLTDM